MYNNSVRITLVFYCIYTCSLALGQDMSKRFLPHSDKEALVHAKVIDKTKIDNGIACTLEISHVYYGEKELFGKTFTCHISSDKWSHGFNVKPELKLQEQGIWFLRKLKDAWYGRGYYRFGIRWPARENLSPRYEQAKTLADCIEKISSLRDSENQTELLKEYASSPKSEVSGWAIRALDELGLNEFLLGLTSDKKLPIVGQIALDEVLSKKSAETWNDSKERLSILDEWVSSRLDQHDATAVMRRLDVISQHKLMEHESLLELLKTAIANREIPKTIRRSYCFLVAKAAKQYGNYKNSFHYLIELVKGDEAEIAIGAVYGIANFIPMDAERTGILIALFDKIKIEEVRKALQEMLERAGVQIPSRKESEPEYPEPQLKKNGQEKGLNPELIKEQEPREQPAGEMSKPSADWLVLGSIIAGVMLVGVVLLLLLRRKRVMR